MKAALLTDIETIEVADIPAPGITGENDVLIRMESTGICGSDMHYYLEGGIGDAVVEFPFVIGHEGAGTVEETGSGVTRVKPGDRIAIDPAVSCCTCDQCLEGRVHTCRNIMFLGCPGQMGGCLAEYLVMPEGCCYPLPDSMSFDQAVAAEPLAVGLYGVRLSGLAKGEKAGVLGAGPIGLSAILCARHGGAGALYATEKITSRLQAALTAGADWTGNPDKEDVVANILEKEPDGLDIVFECSGSQEAMDQAIRMLKPGGRLVIIGIPGFEAYTFPAHDMRRKEIRIQNVRRQNGCTADAIELIAERGIDVDFMITHGFDLSETAKAFRLVSRYEDGAIKGMIHYERL